jgi:hypothetical protein
MHKSIHRRSGCDILTVSMWVCESCMCSDDTMWWSLKVSEAASATGKALAGPLFRPVVVAPCFFGRYPNWVTSFGGVWRSEIYTINTYSSDPSLLPAISVYLPSPLSTSCLLRSAVKPPQTPWATVENPQRSLLDQTLWEKCTLTLPIAVPETNNSTEMLMS